MKINKESALKLWNERYGEKDQVHDYAGRIMYKSAYDDRTSAGGFNIDHVFPQSKGGSNEKENLVLCNILTNDEKADKTTFKANEKSFQVKRIKGTQNYKIYSLDNSKEDILEKKNAEILALFNKIESQKESLVNSLKEKYLESLEMNEYMDNLNDTKESFKDENCMNFLNALDKKPYWDTSFGDKLNAFDFANRPLYYDHFEQNYPDGWSVIPLNPNVPMDRDNFLVVNLKTKEEINGRTNFTIKGVQYSIIKNGQGGYELYSEDNLNPYSVNNMLTYFNNLEDKKEFMSQITIYIRKQVMLYENNNVVELGNKLFKFCSKIISLNDKIELLNQSIVNEQIEYKLDHIFKLSFKFYSRTEEEIREIIEEAKIFNTYFSYYFVNKYGFDYKIIINTNEISINGKLAYQDQHDCLNYSNTIFVDIVTFLNGIQDTDSKKLVGPELYIRGNTYEEFNVVKTKIRNQLAHR